MGFWNTSFWERNAEYVAKNTVSDGRLNWSRLHKLKNYARNSSMNTFVSGLLGVHHLNNGPFDADKFATLVVEGCHEENQDSEACDCSQHSTCADCTSNGCAWDGQEQLCGESGWWLDPRTWFSGWCTEYMHVICKYFRYFLHQ